MDWMVKEGQPGDNQAIDQTDQADIYTDCTQLPKLSLETIERNLRLKYLRNTDPSKIYTWCGTVLFSINPYGPYPEHYDDPTKSAYFAHAFDFRRPHIYATAELILKSLYRRTRGDSHEKVTAAGVFSGPSGSGKTEGTKILLDYLAWCSYKGIMQNAGDHGMMGIENKLDTAALVLECMGNALTKLNCNSSRFGKLTEICVDSNSVIVHNDFGKTRCIRIKSASIQTCLLASTRLANPIPEEQNFHIFYSFLDGLSRSESYHVNGNACWRILGGTIQEAYVRYRWGEVRSAFKELEFSVEEIDNICKCLAAILHLGQVASLGLEKGQSEFSREELSHVSAAAELLGVSNEKLLRCLTRMKIVEEYKVLTFSEVLTRIQGTIQFFYKELFHWVVAKINCVLGSASCPTNDLDSILILDIYGFETQSSNRLEQLCINYANDRLQEVFLSHLIYQEAEFYAREGIISQKIPHQKDFEELKLMGQGLLRSVGENVRVTQKILNILNDSALGPCVKEDQRDVMAIRMMISNNISTHSAERPGIKNQRLNLKTFIVRHFCEDVGYCVQGFAQQNKDSVAVDVISLIVNTCPNDFFRCLAWKKYNEKKSTKSVGRLFMIEVERIADALFNTSCCYFVRCFKPNTVQSPSFVDDEVLRKQLQDAGIDILARTLKCGYQCRLTYEEVCRRWIYPFCSDFSHLHPRSATQLLMNCMDIDARYYSLGLTRLFLKQDILDSIERNLRTIVHEATEDQFRVALKRTKQLQMRMWLKACIWAVILCVKMKRLSVKKGMARQTIASFIQYVWNKVQRRRAHQTLKRVISQAYSQHNKSWIGQLTATAHDVKTALQANADIRAVEESTTLDDCSDNAKNPDGELSSPPESCAKMQSETRPVKPHTEVPNRKRTHSRRRAKMTASKHGENKPPHPAVECTKPEQNEEVPYRNYHYRRHQCTRRSQSRKPPQRKTNFQMFECINTLDGFMIIARGTPVKYPRQLTRALYRGAILGVPTNLSNIPVLDRGVMGPTRSRRNRFEETFNFASVIGGTDKKRDRCRSRSVVTAARSSSTSLKTKKKS